MSKGCHNLKITNPFVHVVLQWKFCGNKNSIIKHQTEIIVHSTVKAIILSHSFDKDRLYMYKTYVHINA